MAHRLRRNREAPILLRPDRGRFALRVSGRARMSAPPATRIETSDLAPFSAPYATADRLIEDKLRAGDFSHHEVRSDALLVSASAWALGLSARIIQAHETPETIVASLVGRLGLPAVRTATRQAMRLLGAHFVLGQDIGEALDRAAAHDARYSFDMLGEGARTAADAGRYFDAYAAAIAAIGRRGGNRALPDRHGISVKLSALHPRFEAISRERV